MNGGASSITKEAPHRDVDHYAKIPPPAGDLSAIVSIVSPFWTAAGKRQWSPISKDFRPFLAKSNHFAL